VPIDAHDDLAARLLDPQIQARGLNAPRIGDDTHTPVGVQHGKKQDPQGWYGEETLDVEAVHGMAPAANVVYVGAPNNRQDLDAALSHRRRVRAAAVPDRPLAPETATASRLSTGAHKDPSRSSGIQPARTTSMALVGLS
jgi:hypothetical protein